MNVQKNDCEKRVNEKWVDIKDRELFTALTTLPTEAQCALYMRFWECKSIAQIARRLNISWDNADKLLTSTLLDLRGKIKRPIDLKALTGIAA